MSISNYLTKGELFIGALSMGMGLGILAAGLYVGLNQQNIMPEVVQKARTEAATQCEYKRRQQEELCDARVQTTKNEVGSEYMTRERDVNTRCAAQVKTLEDKLASQCAAMLVETPQDATLSTAENNQKEQNVPETVKKLPPLKKELLFLERLLNSGYEQNPCGDYTPSDHNKSGCINAGGDSITLIYNCPKSISAIKSLKLKDSEEDIGKCDYSYIKISCPKKNDRFSCEDNTLQSGIIFKLSKEQYTPAKQLSREHIIPEYYDNKDYFTEYRTLSFVCGREGISTLSIFERNRNLSLEYDFATLPSADARKYQHTFDQQLSTLYTKTKQEVDLNN
ncbi:MAG: hypothetical protein A2729_04945 [Candidatus Buchananbacteria bacterium RIFCSPHIGHO2_01_FULL_39_14]|uniref:Uncharacterized protein n=1 Tax=Candidatus Buchananbacteria bacterium RIFCSPHIGHO2_01_FULL_39_14 TaxID=1797532 RepID=A0A1G1XVF5_9BACT|nr:MAG: hypothetical protein A2729_04945 [Candidatus Buchananbacteria bacterium RIFCSPHIGHO2_01_FULL_39_14]